MGVRISFVIPVLNEAQHIEALLLDLRVRYPQCEIIVVDGGSCDATVRLATPQCDHVLHSAPGRARQMNLGAQQAAGEYLFFLHADSMPTVDDSALEAAFMQGPAWGFCRLQLRGERPVLRVIAWFINLRSAHTRVATGDQMLFISRQVFYRAGGFADIPLMEDVEMSKRLRRSAAPHVIAAPVRTSARRWESQGVWVTVLRMWLLRLAYFCGVEPTRLARHYRGR